MITINKNINNKIILEYVDSKNIYSFLYKLKNKLDLSYDYKNNKLEIPIQETETLLNLIEEENIFISFEDKEYIKKISNYNKTLKERILIEKNMSYEDFVLNEEFLAYQEKVLKNLDVNISGIEDFDLIKITQKQLIKTFVFDKLNNIINFSEPGTGKTLMTLMTLVSKIKKNEKVIIVCPINSMKVWKEEIEKFVKFENENKMVHFHNDSMHKNFSDKPENDLTDFEYARFILINYESVSKLAKHELSLKFLHLTGGYHIVFDEAHRIKNGESIRNNFSKEIGSKAKSRVVLTGTPFSTSISEVEEMVELAWPEENPFISKNKFKRYKDEIVLYDIKNIISRESIKEETLKHINDFSNELEPLYFNLTKKKDFDIENADDRVGNPNYVKPLRIQIEIDLFIKEKIESIENMLLNGYKYNKEEKESLEKSKHAYYTASQQNITNPLLLKNYVKFNHFFNNFETPSFKDLPKILEATKLVQEIIGRGEKVIVWFTFVNNILWFKELLLSMGINVEEIHGETKQKDRANIISSFSNPTSKIQVLISNPATIAESISLHKSVWNSIFVERTLSYFRWAQAKDRIHRVGSKHKVIHNYIKTENLWMEEKTFENLNKKDIISKEIFNNINSIESQIKMSQLIDIEKETYSEYGEQEEDIYDLFPKDIERILN